MWNALCSLLFSALLICVGGSDTDADLLEWFLTDTEISSATGGWGRQTLPVFTRNNDVAMIADGLGVFSEMLLEVSDASEGDMVVGSFWSIGAKYLMSPPLESSSMLSVFGGAQTRGVDTRLLLNDNPTHQCEMQEFREEMTALGSPTTIVTHPLLGGSFHQKMLALRNSDRYFASAYVGGIDPGPGRWDTSSHGRVEEDKDKRDANPELELADVQCALGAVTDATQELAAVGWHDVSAWVWGPAATDIGTNWAQQWNALTKGDLVEIPTVPDSTYMFSPPPRDITNPRDIARSSSASVQTVRTFPCTLSGMNDSSKAHFPFVPGGEFTILEAQLKAFRRATKYIYIEDQYFFIVDELLDALIEALDRIDYLIILTGGPTFDLPGLEKWQDQMWSGLKKSPHFSSKVRGYIRGDGVFIHSKATIVDDIYVNVGTANRNVRSMTFDTELAISVIDSETVMTPDGYTARVQARDLRCHLWADHVHGSPADFQDATLDDAVKLLEDAMEAGTLIWLNPPSNALLGAFVDNISELADADGRCGAATCWETPSCLAAVIIASMLALSLLAFVWTNFYEIVEFVAYCFRFATHKCVAHPSVTPDDGKLSVAPTVHPSLTGLKSALVFQESKHFHMEEILSFSTVFAGKEDFKVYADNGSGEVGEVVLLIKSDEDGGLEGHVRDRMILRRPINSAADNSDSIEDGKGAPLLMCERRLLSPGKCSWRSWDSNQFVLFSSDKKTPIGVLRKAILLPVYRLYPVTKKGGIGKRAALVVEGDFLQYNYVVLNDRREICASFKRAVEFIDSAMGGKGTSYTLTLAPSVDLSVISTVIAMIDEMVDDSS